MSLSDVAHRECILTTDRIRLVPWRESDLPDACKLWGDARVVVLAYDLHLARLENYWSWDHLHHVPSTFPLLVLDMYEHAYHLDYGAQAAKYLDAFMANVNWEEVNQRYLAIRKHAVL